MMESNQVSDRELNDWSLPRENFHPLEKRDRTARVLWFIGSWLVVVAFAIFSVYKIAEEAKVDVEISGYAVGGVAILFFILGLVNLYKVFDNQGYILRDTDISYRTGWLVESVSSVPFGRVQHVETVQRFQDKLLGLGRVSVYTAGGSSDDLSIRGIPYERSLQIKEFILNRISTIADGEEE